LVSEPEVRLAIINAILRDVVTKHDVAELRHELKVEIEALEARLSKDIDRLYRLLSVAVLGILVSIASTVLVRLLAPQCNRGTLNVSGALKQPPSLDG